MAKAAANPAHGPLRRRGRRITRKLSARAEPETVIWLERIGPRTSPLPRLLGVCALSAALGGCAGYHPSPLDVTSSLKGSVSALRHPGVPLPAVLPIQTVAYLAVVNDPDLRAARARVGVAEAQVLEAGLLPNPQISGNYLPVTAGPGIIPAWTAGLTEDIKALVTLSARRESARAKAAQVNADLLWREWQVIARARLLSVQLVEGERLARLLAQSRDLLSGRYARARRALAAGNATLMTVTPDLAALQAVQIRLADLARLQQTRRHDLDALLGLEPDVSIPLPDRIASPAIDAAAIRRSLPGLADRRPDLIALQLGYRAQEAAVRAAILGQFPALLIGVTAARDSSNIQSLFDYAALRSQRW